MIRVFSGLVLIIGLLYFTMGALVLVETSRVLHQVGQVFNVIEEEIPGVELNERLFESYGDRILISGGLAAIGVITLIVGIGIWFRKEWARISWLVIVSFLVLSYWLLSELSVQEFILDDWINTGLITLMGIVSWVYLTKLQTRNMFKRDEDIRIRSS